MRFFFRPRATLFALLLALAASLPFLAAIQSRTGIFFAEVTLASNQAGVAQVFYDVGRDFNEQDSAYAAMPGPAAIASRCRPGSTAICALIRSLETGPSP